ncbi:MAG: ABC transporter ATP-binding protein [Firmicutes bacterium]|nr:ABC transporter ATP-binding protein [Dethiobacter sp.]MBS3889089.1 ABC transporter ATP-binding protein [Bacillota bacterium]MBS4053378.1 ABC transporter ATP-binding protein [Thermaerobacter sp.]
MNEIIMRTERLNKAFSLGETIYAVSDVSLYIPAGKIVAIVGPSGCGKSTLLSLLGGLDRPMSGDIFLERQSFRMLSEDGLAMLRRRKLGYVFQFFNLIPHLTAIENVMLPMSFIGVSRLNAKKRAAELLAQVGLTKRLNHLPLQLSGGEQQRVAISRALANNPALVLADEPTGNLDSSSKNDVLDLFKMFNAMNGQTFVLITHDASVAGIAQKVVRMVDGRVLEEK